MYSIGCDSKTNGEYLFYTSIKDKIDIIFDVGTSINSEFIDFEKEVHYFEPVKSYIDNLSKQPNKNKRSYFNNFGLSNENKELYYYPLYESFYDRINSCKVSDSPNKVVLNVKKGNDYINEYKISHVDFLKIDTEGYELNVLKGFEDFLYNVKIIQFEYGGTFLDNNVKLVDVKNYLEKYGFYKFAYLTLNTPMLITDFTDHYKYCNIVCVNKNSDIVPY